MARPQVVAQRRPDRARSAREGAILAPKVWLALGVVYVVWGSTYLGIDLAVRTIPPFFMAGMRFLIAGGLLYAWATRRPDPSDRPTARHWLSAFLIALPMLAVGNSAVGWAEQTLDTGTASLIIASVPLWMALLDRAFYGQRLARTIVVGLVVGFGGVGLLVAPGGADGAGSTAALVLVFTSLAWAIGSLYARHAVLPRRPLVGVGMQMLAGGVMLTAFSAATGEVARVHPAAISLESWLGLAYLVVAGSLLAFTAYMWLLRAAPTSLVGTYAYVNPVVAVLLGTMLLGEPLTWQTLVGGGIILASVALIVRTPRPKQAAAPEAAPAAAMARAR
ncbi:MAG TPA: EamA family transporter [Gaiellaceae bacterium]|nr:EamA family transporter [Gaiellaceae bacterium]